MPKGPCSMHSPVPAAPDASSQHSAPTSVSAAKPWAGAAESCGVACPSSSSAALDGSPSSAVDMFILGAEHPGVCSGVRVELSQAKSSAVTPQEQHWTAPAKKGLSLETQQCPSLWHSYCKGKVVVVLAQHLGLKNDLFTLEKIREGHGLYNQRKEWRWLIALANNRGKNLHFYSKKKMSIVVNMQTIHTKHKSGFCV